MKRVLSLINIYDDKSFERGHGIELSEDCSEILGAFKYMYVDIPTEEYLVK